MFAISRPHKRGKRGISNSKRARLCEFQKKKAEATQTPINPLRLRAVTTKLAEASTNLSSAQRDAVSKPIPASSVGVPTILAPSSQVQSVLPPPAPPRRPTRCTRSQKNDRQHRSQLGQNEHGQCQPR